MRVVTCLLDQVCGHGSLLLHARQSIACIQAFGCDLHEQQVTIDKVPHNVSSCCAQCIGSCALNLCSIAAGRADAFYEIGFGGPWDVAAGALILEEAGGAVTDPTGG